MPEVSINAQCKCALCFEKFLSTRVTAMLCPSCRIEKAKLAEAARRRRKAHEQRFSDLGKST